MSRTETGLAWLMVEQQVWWISKHAISKQLPVPGKLFYNFLSLSTVITTCFIFNIFIHMKFFSHRGLHAAHGLRKCTKLIRERECTILYLKWTVAWDGFLTLTRLKRAKFKKLLEMFYQTRGDWLGTKICHPLMRQNICLTLRGCTHSSNSELYSAGRYQAKPHQHLTKTSSLLYLVLRFIHFLVNVW